MLITKTNNDDNNNNNDNDENDDNNNNDKNNNDNNNNLVNNLTCTFEPTAWSRLIHFTQLGFKDEIMGGSISQLIPTLWDYVGMTGYLHTTDRFSLRGESTL